MKGGRGMARQKDKNPYRTVGSAAVDLAYTYNQESTARPLPKQEPQRQSQRRTRPQKRPAPRQHMAVSLFSVVGMAAAMMMLVLVIFGYSQVYASAERLDELESQVQSLREDNQKLQSQYDTSINLEEVETRARELGMQQPSAKQIVSIQVPVQDMTVVSSKVASSPLQAAWDAIVETARSLWEYLR